MDKVVLEIIKDILDYNPLEGESLKVAQLGSYQINGTTSIKDSNTVLISPYLITRIRPSHINIPVKSSYLSHDWKSEYKPLFQIYLSPSPGLKRAEPLVASWDTGNDAMLLPDQGFLQAYQLVPRLTDCVMFWDDTSKPKYDVVENKPRSHYDFPHHSEAYVKINQGYLHDYATLRNKAAVLIYQERRNISINASIERLFNHEDYYTLETSTFEVLLRRHFGKPDIAQLEVNGYKVLFNPLKVKEPEPKWPGHKWFGIDKLITGHRDEDMRFLYAYVSDDVLNKYEGDPDYDIYPETGSVQYKNQWSVSYCERVGRNSIKVELKKLYEGTPYSVIDYWNKFSIDPSTIDSNKKNVAERSERLFRKYLLFGRLMSDVVNKLSNLNSTSSDIITFEETAVLYEGLLKNSKVQPITYHISSNSFKQVQFINRCKELYKLLIENLVEKTLRKCVDTLGFDPETTKTHRSLKLLDTILTYLSISSESGLHPTKSCQEIILRVEETPSLNLSKLLFALNDIRQLDAHNSTQSFKPKLHKALSIYKIEPNSIGNNYAYACDQVYDSLNDWLGDTNRFLVEVHRLF